MEVGHLGIQLFFSLFSDKVYTFFQSAFSDNLIFENEFSFDVVSLNFLINLSEHKHSP